LVLPWLDRGATLFLWMIGTRLTPPLALGLSEILRRDGGFL